MASRVHSIYLDELENSAVRKIADANRLSVNAVLRAFVRQALGVGGELRVEIPDEIADWAKARRTAAAAGRRIA